MFFCVSSFVTSSKLIIFCIILLQCYILVSSLSLTTPLFVPYAYVYIKSIYCILLSSFEFKAILLITSVKTLSPSLLHLYCVYNINLLVLMNSLGFVLQQKKLSVSILNSFFFLFLLIILILYLLQDNAILVRLELFKEQLVFHNLI